MITDLIGGPSKFYYPYTIDYSCRFNDDDSAYTSRTFHTPTNNRKWTYSFWVKRCNLDTGNYILNARTDTNNRSGIFTNTTGNNLRYFDYQAAAYTCNEATAAFVRDVSSWYHFVIAVDTTDATAADRVKLYINGVQQDQDAGTDMTQNTDTMINSAVAHYVGRSAEGATIGYFTDVYLAEVHFVDGQQLTAASFGESKNGIWVPKNPAIDQLTVDSDVSGSFSSWANIDWETFTSSGLSISSAINSAAWGQSYSNEFSVSAGEVYELTYNLTINSGANPSFWIAGDTGATVSRSGAIKSNLRAGTGNKVYIYIDTTDATAYPIFSTSAAAAGNYAFELVSLKKMTGTGYGTNGFYLDFSNSSHFGEDQSGNNSDFTDSGLASNDQVEDTPTNNWCTLNCNIPTPGTVTYSNGNLVALTSSANKDNLVGTMSTPTTGKWYWEVTITEMSSDCVVGLFRPDDDFDNTQSAFAVVGYYSSNGNLYTSGGAAAYGASYTQGDVIGVALDCDAQTVNFYKNNAAQGAADISDEDTGVGWLPAFGDNNVADTVTFTTNFGQLGFTYTPPTGYKALNWSNVTTAMQLQEPLYLEGNKGLDVVTYTGDDTDGRDISGLSFSPDLVWIKKRNAAANHQLYDSIRGVRNYLNSNSTAVEGNTEGFEAFNSDGFQLNEAAGSILNTSGETYVAWNWLEDPNYGFDIVSYTGTGVAKTEAHNLGVVPEMMIVKNLDSVKSWAVYHKDLDGGTAPEAHAIWLDLTAAESNSPTAWNSTAPTSSVFTVGTADETNMSGDEMIAYLFASVEGYSKVFSYTGNGSAAGPFVYCGFRPRWVLIKDVTNVNSWLIYDTERDQDNVMQLPLYPDLNNAEGLASAIDSVSNGFKVRTNWTYVNTSSANIVGIAFAETPFPWSNAR